MEDAVIVPDFPMMRIRVVLLASICVCATSLGQTTVERSDQPVSLTGILKIARGYGPPGYGEDKKVDIPVSYWALYLPMKITIACPPSDEKFKDIDCGETNRLRLFLPDSPPNGELDTQARKLVGRKVVVTGVLQRRDAMIQMTPIYMNVLKISEAKGTK